MARIALIPFVVFYVAWEALQGIANGVLGDKVNELPPADQAVGAELIQEFAESPLVRDFGVLAILGSIALIVATIALGIALRKVGAPRATPWLFGIAGWFITAHPPPYGPIGLALFVITTLYVFRRKTGAAEEPRVEPSAA